VRSCGGPSPGVDTADSRRETFAKPDRSDARRGAPTSTLPVVFPRRSTALAAAITFVLAACGGGSDAEPGAAPSPSEAPSAVPSAVPSTTTGGAAPAGSTSQETGNAATDSAAPEPAPATTAPSTTGSAGATDAAGTPAPEPTPEPTVAPVAVPAALDFSATTIDGSEIELGQFAGRPVLLWFWAPW
jgi:hypothetical protein